MWNPGPSCNVWGRRPGEGGAFPGLQGENRGEDAVQTWGGGCLLSWAWKTPLRTGCGSDLLSQRGSLPAAQGQTPASRPGVGGHGAGGSASGRCSTEGRVGSLGLGRTTWSLGAPQRGLKHLEASSPTRPAGTDAEVTCDVPKASACGLCETGAPLWLGILTVPKLRCGPRLQHRPQKRRHPRGLAWKSCGITSAILRGQSSPQPVLQGGIPPPSGRSGKELGGCSFQSATRPE